MRLSGCDYVSGPPAAVLRAHGLRFALRYLSTPGNPKNLTRAELAELRRAGIMVGLVFETTANRALSGRAGGVEDAASVEAQLVALGLSRRTPVYFAVDFDPQPGALPAVLAYIAGAAHRHGKRRTGTYGGGRVLIAVAQRKLCRYFWHAAASAWGPPFAGRHLQQGGTLTVAGHTLDADTAYRRDFGQIAGRPRLIRTGLALMYARWKDWRAKVQG